MCPGATLAYKQTHDSHSDKTNEPKAIETSKMRQRRTGERKGARRNMCLFVRLSVVDLKDANIRLVID